MSKDTSNSSPDDQHSDPGFDPEATIEQSKEEIDAHRALYSQSTPLPKSIGQYKILSEIGEGGMGTVYEAEQDSPRRKVALKVIKPGVVSKNLLLRFEIEAQILGKLDHPGIATIFEAGTFDDGHGKQPFFAMEFVQGGLLTDYADKHKLGTRDRLGLLAKIADAVQHAHQKGVIHRDLKPGNILVNEKGQIKILDFGVARATDADIQTATMQTDIGQLIGTIPYMSPEQASGNPDELDTRSDVYALGIIAYELLTGEMPYDVKQKMIHEAVRVIREDAPKPLSSINKTFRGDVEIIVGKALVKEKDRRYQSASDLASDIHRYINNEPIEARPPSTMYQLRKFSRRNKALVAGVIAVLLVSIVGALVSINFAIGEAEQKRIAIGNAEQARVERDKAEQVAAFLTDMLSGVGAQVAQGADTTLMRGILNKTASRVGEELDGQPEIEAKIRSHLGETYLQLRDFEHADENFLRARDLYRSLASGDDFDVAKSLGNLGLLRVTKDRPQEAATLQREALAMWRRVDPADATVIPWSKMNLANTLVKLDEFEEAEALLLGALESFQIELGENNEEVGVAYNSLANLKQHTEDYDGAEDYYRRALATHRAALGDDHPFVATDLHNLGYLIAELGRNKEAIELHEQSLARCRLLYPDGHEQTASNLVRLATLYRYDDERSPEAPGMLSEAIVIQSKLYGEHSETVALSHRELGKVLSAQYDYEGAIREHQHSVTLFKALYGEENNFVAISLDYIARVLASDERYDEASATYDRVLEIQTALFGDAHPELAMTLVNIGSMHRKAGNNEAAEASLLKALDVFEAAGHGTTAHTASAYENLGRIYRATDRLEESADVLRKALEIRKEVNGPNSRGTLGAAYVFAGTLIETGGYDEAEALLLHTLADPEGVINGRIRTLIQRRQADLLFAMERYDECVQVLEECYRAYVESGSTEKAGEALTELVRVSERHHELDPSTENETTAARWRQLLEEQG